MDSLLSLHSFLFYFHFAILASFPISFPAFSLSFFLFYPYFILNFSVLLPLCTHSSNLYPSCYFSTNLDSGFRFFIECNSLKKKKSQPFKHTHTDFLTCVRNTYIYMGYYCICMKHQCTTSINISQLLAVANVLNKAQLKLIGQEDKLKTWLLMAG